MRRAAGLLVGALQVGVITGALAGGAPIGVFGGSVPLTMTIPAIAITICIAAVALGVPDNGVRNTARLDGGGFGYLAVGLTNATKSVGGLCLGELRTGAHWAGCSRSLGEGGRETARLCPR
jgi:hypothetical protein